MFDDLRGAIQKLDEIGQLQRVEGADWNLEIGTITELMSERQGPALLFDKVKGYPEGYRVAANLLYMPTKRMQTLALGVPEGLSDMEVIKYWWQRWRKYEPVSPVEVASGPVKENVLTGDEIDILKFPVPKWHEKDGGRYIGTGVINITRDPDEGWVNVGTYRVMVHDGKTLAFYASPGKHAAMIRRKYWARGEECPVVLCFGQEPFLFHYSGAPLPWGVSEFDLAGYMKGKPIEVIKGDLTGLPIPATAEIAVEGFSPSPSVDSRNEGPFGEWTGYYGSGLRPEPVIRIAAIYHRNNPIIHGCPPLRGDLMIPVIPIWNAMPLWDALDRAGMVGIKGVWAYQIRTIAVISIEQRYPGHAKQVATLAADFLYSGACASKYVIVVDDDIDPSNWNEVMWAVWSRCDPETSIDLVRGLLTSPLDPSLPPEKRRRGDMTQNKLIINACRPYHWMDEFPPVNRSSDELRKKVRDKWGHLFA